LKIGLKNDRFAANEFSTYAKRMKKDWQMYLFVIVPVIYTIVFGYGTTWGLQIAFKDYSAALGIWDSPWVGFENIVRFVKYHNFWNIIKNTLALSLYSMAVGTPAPVLLALALNAVRNNRFKSTAQFCVLLPHFVSMVLLVGMMNQFLNPIVGIYGTIGKALTGNIPVDLFTIPESFRHMEIWSGIWQDTGWNSLLYLAALSAVDMSLHEAATVDGATRIQRMIHIDIPAIIPTFVILFIMRIGGLLNAVTQKVLLMQNQINLEFSEVLGTYVYKQGFASLMPDYSYSTAIGLFNSIVGFILLRTANKVSRKLTETSLW